LLARFTIGTASSKERRGANELHDRGLRDVVWYSGHTGTISIAVLVLRASQNAMKPRIQGVLTQ